MWKKKEKPLPDERIEKESNHLSAKMFYVLTILTAALMLVKIIVAQPVIVYAVEIVTLLVGIGYYVTAEVKSGLWGVKECDEVLTTIHEKNLAKAMNAEFMVLIWGELIYMFVVKAYFLWLPAYFLVWMPPALIITIASIKNGWIIWGTKKREKEGKKDFKKRVAIGSLFYGIIVCGPRCFKDGAFQWKGLLFVAGAAAMWGILFYLIMSGMMKISEKKADKNVKEQEELREE